jgi:hypothetical protein
LKGRLIAYSARHSTATRLLEKGVPDAQVAAILGHKNTAMLYKHYGHLGDKIQKLTDLIGEHSTIGPEGTSVGDCPPQPKRVDAETEKVLPGYPSSGSPRRECGPQASF